MRAGTKPAVVRSALSEMGLKELIKADEDGEIVGLRVPEAASESVACVSDTTGSSEEEDIFRE